MLTQKMRRGTRERMSLRLGEKERPLALSLLFLYVISSPGPALCKLDQPGLLFVLPEVLTPVLRPSFVLFSQALPFLVFQQPPSWTPFSYSNVWQSLFFHPTDEKPESQRGKVDRLISFDTNILFPRLSDPMSRGSLICFSLNVMYILIYYGTMELQFWGQIQNMNTLKHSERGVILKINVHSNLWSEPSDFFLLYTYLVSFVRKLLKLEQEVRGSYYASFFKIPF